MFVLYYGAWTAAVWTAARGQSWLGMLLTLPLFGLCFAWSPRQSRRALLKFILLLAFVGLVLDTLFIASGVLRYTQPSAIAPLGPPWMTVLWGLFAAVLPLSMPWIHGRWVLGALLGAVFAPLSYRGIAALGAIQQPDPLSLGVLALVWGPLMAGIAHISPKLMVPKEHP